MNGTEFGWGLVGPGRIAHKFAEALRGVPGARLVAVQGRDHGRAQDFAQRWQAELATTDLDALLAHPGVQAVYIATPHAFHASAIAQCLGAGKPVLCEKPLVTDAHTAQALCALAERQRCFLMEAVWTRFLPIYAQVGAWLREGAVGRLNTLQSSLCFRSPYDPQSRAFDPAQAGGALLDVGIYNLNITRWVLAQALGHCPPLQGLQAHAHWAPTGVDQRLSAMLDFGNGLVSQFVCGFDGRADNSFRIHGERGWIEIEALFWGAASARLHLPDAPVRAVSAPHAVNGFEGQIAEAQRCIAAGLLESPTMPWAETLQTTAWMDAIRARIGLRYPFDPA
jgi:predicted dehydrogenase